MSAKFLLKTSALFLSVAISQLVSATGIPTADGLVAGTVSAETMTQTQSLIENENMNQAQNIKEFTKTANATARLVDLINSKSLDINKYLDSLKALGFEIGQINDDLLKTAGGIAKGVQNQDYGAVFNEVVAGAEKYYKNSNEEACKEANKANPLMDTRQCQIAGFSEVAELQYGKKLADEITAKVKRIESLKNNLQKATTLSEITEITGQIALEGNSILLLQTQADNFKKSLEAQKEIVAKQIKEVKFKRNVNDLTNEYKRIGESNNSNVSNIGGNKTGLSSVF